MGLADYEGHVILPARYHSIHGNGDPLLTVRVGDKHAYRASLITADGAEVLPPMFDRIGWCRDKRHFYGCAEDGCEMYLLEPKAPPQDAEI